MITECHECSLSVNIPNLSVGQKAICPRCGYKITAKYHNSIDRVLSFSITAIIFFVLSLQFSFLSFSSNGIEKSILVIDTIFILFEQEQISLGILTILSIFLLPTTILVLSVILFGALKLNVKLKYAEQFINWLFQLIPWSMVEIFIIGTLVSLIKITSLADVGFGFSFYAFILFSLSMIGALYHLDQHELENAFQINNRQERQKKQNYSNNIQTTWALLLTSTLLYFPANLLPIMTTRVLGQDEPATILGGVIILWEMGSYPIAMVIFIASVFIPVAKILLLSWLNYSIQKNHDKLHIQRIKMYRITEAVGRWSMVDVYVVIILVCLIQLGNTMSVFPGTAALSFSGVVILTMLAAINFDQKRIWNDANLD